jgi:hypothetical protein
MPETKEWTLMFYFASDNPLAISVVSQLKAIKAAGFHPDANVITQFDPFTPGTPTHIFDVNLVNKLKAGPDAAGIGFRCNDALVRTLIEDKLWRDEKTRSVELTDGTTKEGVPIREALKKILRDKHGISYNPPEAPHESNGNGAHTNGGGPPKEPDPETSLRSFLHFCAAKYPARHYMLFLLGHGVVVGNDIFMLDEHADKNALTLTELGDILSDFNNDIELEGSTFELVSFHSCSVSSLEVAYELQGTAKFMLASQGPAFVGSWPYREILIRIFKDLETQNPINVRETLLKIFEYTMFSSADYLLAGYSFQLTLCDLQKIPRVKAPLERLTNALLTGLNDLLSRDFILLSHWKAQIFYNEMFTDIYDFCFCFRGKVREVTQRGGVTLTPEVLEINRACGDLMDVLVKENPKKRNDPVIEQLIIAAESIGPAYQYSRGLSVYFPWSEPSEDSQIMAEYEKYRFHTKFGEASWLTFLRAYFETTMREVSQREPDPRRFLPKLSIREVVEQNLDEDIASLVYTNEGVLDHTFALAGPKGDPMDKTGFDSDVSIKNYPRDTRARNKRRNEADTKFPVSEAIGLLDQAIANNHH